MCFINSAYEPKADNKENQEWPYGPAHRAGSTAGVLHAADLEEHLIPRVYLTRLVVNGVRRRPSRGIYVLVGADVTENHSLAEPCRRVPHGVVCLFSELQFHGLITEIPFEIWLAIDRKSQLLKVTYPTLRIVRFSDSDLMNGVVAHNVAGVPFKVTDPARTVVDGFAHRRKIGIDVPLTPTSGNPLFQDYRIPEILRAAIPQSEKLTEFPRAPFIGELNYPDVGSILGRPRKWFSRPEQKLIDNLSEYLTFKLARLKLSNRHGHG